MKLTILDGNALNPGDLSWDCFKKYADVTVYPRTKPEEVIQRIGTSDCILLNKISIDENILNQCKNLKYIGVLATGYNVIDVEAVKKAGICTTYIPSYSTMAVSQHVFSLITYFSNHVAIHNESVKKGNWISSLDFCYWNKPLIELCGKTLGILGYGNIGKQVEKIAQSFGMNTIICPHNFSKQIKNCVTQDELWKKSDFITLHAPLTNQTFEIINKNSISKMKDGVYIINTARGALVNENDVSKALYSKKIAGYAADVLCNEPMKEDCPLLNAPNCVLTPHIAWAPYETRSRLLHIALENFEMWLKGSPQNTIY